jgi:flavin reductase (DIM6/NTAB) family NADH-FMN oxidoreductase RutF
MKDGHFPRETLSASEAHMEIDPQRLSPTASYKLLISCIVPRPIAWVSTVSLDGVHNLAPFSFFMGVCGDPPTLAFSVGPRSSPAPGAARVKDTVRNLEATGEFVVNVVDDTLAERMNLTSGEYPPEADEFAVAGLMPAPSARVRAPRVLEAPISMECRVGQILQIGRGPHSLVLGEIVYFQVRDDLYDPATGRLDMQRLHPVGRLAGELYTYVHDLFEMKRPDPNYVG